MRALNILTKSVRPRGNKFHLQENREEIQHKKEKPQNFPVFACIVTYSSLLPFLPLLVDLTIFEYKNAKISALSATVTNFPSFSNFTIRKTGKKFEILVVGKGDSYFWPKHLSLPQSPPKHGSGSNFLLTSYKSSVIEQCEGNVI